MSAYLIVQATILDIPRFQKYRDAVVPLIMSFGGTLAAANTQIEVFEGAPDPRSAVIFAFPAPEAIRAFWTSPEYMEIKKLREGAATLKVWVCGGT